MELTMSDQGQAAPEGIDLAKAYLDMAAKLREAQTDIARLKAGNGHRLSFKVSEKGAVSVYGLGRFPVTLYGQQWPRLFAEMENILAFIKANEAKLSVKE
jgi:hypothetical protein